MNTLGTSSADNKRMMKLREKEPDFLDAIPYLERHFIRTRQLFKQPKPYEYL